MNITETATKTGAGLHRAQDKLEALGRSAGDALDEARHGTADAFENAATSVRASGRQGAEAMQSLSASAAGKLDSTAAYVRTHDVGGMFTNLQRVIRRNPTAFLCLAASVAFLAGSVMRRDQSA